MQLQRSRRLASLVVVVVVVVVVPIVWCLNPVVSLHPVASLNLGGSVSAEEATPEAVVLTVYSDYV